MSASLTLNGVEELKAALRNLPAHLAQEAGGIVTGRAESAAAKIRSRYGRKTGDLIRGVKVERVVVSGAGAIARVKSTGRLAYIYENGTQVTRRWSNGKSTGIMPASHTVAQVAVEERRGMVEDLIGLVEREGFTVRR